MKDSVRWSYYNFSVEMVRTEDNKFWCVEEPLRHALGLTPTQFVRLKKSYRDELDQTRHKISAAVELRGKGWSVNEESIYSKDDVILLALVNGSFKSAALMKIVAEKAVVT